MENTQTTPLTTFKYSAFLGGVYASDAATEAKIAEAKIAIGGETVVKRSFTGSKGDGPSAKAIAILAAAGINSVTMQGPLSAVRVVPRQVNGKPAPYLNVTLGTLAGKQFLSVEMTSKAAQHLVRKLTAAVPGAETEIRLYADYGQRNGAPRAFADHFASAQQNGVELKGTNPKDMWPVIKAAQAPLIAAGVADPQMLRTLQDKVTLNWHLALMNQIAATFECHYLARNQQSVQPPATESEAAPVPAVAVVAPAPAVVAPAPVVVAPVPAPVAQQRYDPFGLNDEPVVPPPRVLPSPSQIRPRVADPFAF